MKWLKNHLLYPNLTTRYQNVENSGLQTNLKLLINLIFWKLAYLISQCSGQDFDKNFLDSKHVLKAYFKPSRKNQHFGFLPPPSKDASMKNDHLSNSAYIKPMIGNTTLKGWFRSLIKVSLFHSFESHLCLNLNMNPQKSVRNLSKVPRRGT